MGRVLRGLAAVIAGLAGLIILANMLWPLPQRLSAEPPPVDVSGTLLARAARALHQGPESNSGIHALGDGREAFAARVVLARTAEKKIDAQYYIWHGDLSGKLLLNEMVMAANRGVKIRLLIDDNTTAGEDELLAAINAHGNIEIRLFNPFTMRFLRVANYVADFHRLNRRMHNKSLTADDNATIVGGRNVGDEYFGANEGMQYADADILVMGRGSHDVARNFERFWVSPSSYPAEDILPAMPTDKAKAITEEIAALARSEDGLAYLELARKSNLIQSLINRTATLEWTNTTMLSDDPDKGLGKIPSTGLLAASLGTALSATRERLDIASAYFVPGVAGTDFLTGLAVRGVDVRLLTNTLASNDVIPVHAGYQRYRKNLLQGGVKLFELKAVFDQMKLQRDTSPGLRFGASSASLHAKLFVMDKRYVFISSYNFDPRSLYLNCEMGILVDSPALARSLTQPFDEFTGKGAYALSLQDGEITWRSADRTYDVDPDSTWMQRAAVHFLSLFPIEWML